MKTSDLEFIIGEVGVSKDGRWYHYSTGRREWILLWNCDDLLDYVVLVLNDPTAFRLSIGPMLNSNVSSLAIRQFMATVARAWEWTGL